MRVLVFIYKAAIISSFGLPTTAGGQLLTSSGFQGAWDNKIINFKFKIYY